MLDALDVHEGHDVYEAGTGTGYNAGVLSFLAGDKHVTTVDRTEALTVKARPRLNAVGFDPLVIHGDGANDVPGDAVFDRIISTASVRRIPPGWLTRIRPGGIMVVPVKGTLAGGTVARLTKLPDGSASGHLLHTPAAFMPLISGTPVPAQMPVIPYGPCPGRRDLSARARRLDILILCPAPHVPRPRPHLRNERRRAARHDPVRPCRRCRPDPADREVHRSGWTSPLLDALAGGGYGFGSGDRGRESDTKVPRPTSPRVQPSSRTCRMAFAAVAFTTPNSWAISRVDGTRLPGG
ncbi:hypothetical protein ACH5AC_06250 [Streptomyces sp. NPDC018693]|uniref:hypothetical protein n=1 Tax=Streptomyces sp. NPDC018693 TaxID=3365051 RepID=UPI00378F0D3E